MEIHTVIGANFGDEGKGIITASLSKESARNCRVINVLSNGGPQRGHTVKLKDGTEHVFKHFGAGTFSGAISYYYKNFLLNPMQFVKEYRQLMESEKSLQLFTVAEKSCRFTTPFDVIYNLLKLESNPHTSCGMGIWNTILRYQNKWVSDSISFYEFCKLPLKIQIKHLKTIKTYYLILDKTLKNSLGSKWSNIWDSENLILNFIDDCKFMASHITFVDNFKDFSQEFDKVIIENGQGLMLSENRVDEDPENLTPSCTGSNYIRQFLQENDLRDEFINLHYVTRPYLTRHGGINIETKNKKFISTSIQEDTTNEFNEFQGELHYGLLDIEKLDQRIRHDCWGAENFRQYKIILDVTHCDEMDRRKEFIYGVCAHDFNFRDNPYV